LLQAPRPGDEALQAVLRGQRFLARQEYENSVKELQKALALAGNKPPADDAIFHLGLIYAHVGNPKKDNRTAMNYFNRLIKEQPQSPWVEQAKAWVGVLQINEKLSDTLEKSKQVDIEIEEKRRQKERQDR
jgi:tetratricopeptide (TPR) repeat protein